MRFVGWQGFELKGPTGVEEPFRGKDWSGGSLFAFNETKQTQLGPGLAKTGSKEGQEPLSRKPKFGLGLVWNQGFQGCSGTGPREFRNQERDSVVILQTFLELV